MRGVSLALALAMGTTSAVARADQRSGAPPATMLPPDAPKTLPWDGTEPVPAGYHPERRVRKGLVIGGSITLGAGWFATMIVVGLSGTDAQKPWGWIPVVGPLGAALADDKESRAYLVLGGIQAVGAAMLLGGIFAKKQVLVRDDLAITVTPVAAPSIAGLAIGGAF